MNMVILVATMIQSWIFIHIQSFILLSKCGTVSYLSIEKRCFPSNPNRKKSTKLFLLCSEDLMFTSASNISLNNVIIFLFVIWFIIWYVAFSTGSSGTMWGFGCSSLPVSGRTNAWKPYHDCAMQACMCVPVNSAEDDSEGCLGGLGLLLLAVFWVPLVEIRQQCNQQAFQSAETFNKHMNTNI